MKVTVRLLVGFFAAWCVLLYAFFATIALLSGDPKMRAMLGMVTGLLGLWVLIGGAAMYLLRDRVRAAVRKITLDWGVRSCCSARCSRSSKRP